MKKILSKEDKIVNSLSSDLSNLLSENKGREVLILDCFYQFLYSGKVDSIIIVEVLKRFDIKYAKELILGIKVNEGW